MIRKADIADLGRITEIYTFNNRISYFPIFKDEKYSFAYLNVFDVYKNYETVLGLLNELYVYDDGIIKGFMSFNGREIKKLYVELFFKIRVLALC